MGIVDSTEAFEALLEVAKRFDVEEFSLGELAVKFARPRGPVVEEKREPDPAPDALQMLGRPVAAPAGADTFMMPGDKPGDASPTSVGWATEDPETE